MGETVKSGQRLKSRMKFQFHLLKKRRKRGEGDKGKSRLSCEEMRIMLNHLSGEICISMKKLQQQQRRKKEKATDKQIIGIK